MQTKTLTPRQQAVLAFVEDFCQQQGYPPTVREVAAHFGIQPRAADDHLSALKRKGYLRREPGRSRGLALTARSTPGVVEVPLVGQIAAGRPLLAAEQVDDTLPLPEAWTRGREVFLLRVAGHSMAPLFLPGDLVLVQVQSRVEAGEVAVVLLGEEATLKRVYPAPGGVILKGDNPDFPPLELPGEAAAAAQVLGRVVGLYRDFGSREGGAS